MSIKIRDIVTPFSSGFSALSTRQLIQDLTQRYMATIDKTIKVQAFKERDTYYIYAILPSKTNDKYNGQDNIFYDIVLELTPANSGMKQSESVRDYDVKVYNNDPQFMFSFTFAYAKRNGLIRLPNGYYAKKALKEKPKVRNPLLLLGISEHLWFTVMYLDKNKLFLRDNIDKLCDGNKMTFRDLVKTIVPQEEKLREIRDRNLRHKNSERKQKEVDQLTKNEKERAKKEDQDKRHREGHARSSLESSLNSTILRNKNFDDLSSNIGVKEKSQLNTKRLKNDSLYKSNLSTTNLKSSLG